MMSGRMTGGPETTQTTKALANLLAQAARAAMTEGLEFLSTTLRTKYLRGPFPTEIERRTGRFAASWARGDRDNIFTVVQEGPKLIGTLGSQDVRAHILNQGGVIRPTRSQFLAIRTEITRDARGVVLPKYRGPLRNVRNTYVRRTASGKLGVFERIRKNVSVMIALLVKSVTIRGRQYAEKGLREATPGIVARFEARFNTVVQRMNDTLRKLGR